MMLSTVEHRNRSFGVFAVHTIPKGDTATSYDGQGAYNDSSKQPPSMKVYGKETIAVLISTFSD